MCALGHYLEEEGIATVVVALVREHAEAVGNPRTLWVPFELGRPLGTPDDPEFQIRVLRAAFALLDRPQGPVLEDFPEDAPEPADYTGWACPIALPAAQAGTEESHERALSEEIGRLRPWWELARERRARTTVGVSGYDIEEAARLVAAFADGGEPADPAPDRRFSESLKLAADDLRAFYSEAATAQPGMAATSRDLSDWFWEETAAGRMFRAVRDRAGRSEDKGIRLVGGMLLVPRA